MSGFISDSYAIEYASFFVRISYVLDDIELALLMKENFLNEHVTNYL